MKKQLSKTPNHKEIYKRKKLEELVLDFIESNAIHACYGKDSEGIFQVNFLVHEEEQA